MRAVACVGALALLCAGVPAGAAPGVPREVAARMAAAGVPLSRLGVHVQRVDAPGPGVLASLNAERPFVLASTTKVVTSLAALSLLGATAVTGAAPPQAPGTDAAAHDGDDDADDDAADTADDADAGGAAEAADDAGAADASGPAGHAAPASARAPVAAASFVVSVRPGPAGKAVVALRPHPAGVSVVNDVFMEGACGAWAQWRAGRPGELWVRGRWNPACGRQDITRMRAPGAALQPVRHAAAAALAAPARALQALGRGLPDWLRAMNKRSDNALARALMLRLAPPGDAPGGALRAAQGRVHRWLRSQGLREGDIRVEVGSGQSRLERGKPRAMVALLRRAWHDDGARVFVDSLPVAGVDGTLAHRLRGGPAAGRAWLKTGTLRDTRALAGYVRGRSGKVYAVTAIVNHPRAARATPALDALVEWVAAKG